MRRTAILIFVVGLGSLATLLIWRHYAADGQQHVGRTAGISQGENRSTRVAYRPYVDLVPWTCRPRARSGKTCRWLHVPSMPLCAPRNRP